MELDFDKYCVVEGSPASVLRATKSRSKVSNRKSNEKPNYGNALNDINKDFREISFTRYRSASCKDVLSRRPSQEVKEVWRGSVDQSSREVKLVKNFNIVGGRKKIELSQGNSTTSSFGIIDSLCSSDEDTLPAERDRDSVMPISIIKPPSSGDFSSGPSDHLPGSNTRPIGFSSKLDNRENLSSDNAEMGSSKPMIYHIHGSNSIRERDSAVSLPKSLSAKLMLPHSPTQSESDNSRASSPKSRFSPVRKILDPFAKSKSQRSPLSSANGPDWGTVSRPPEINHNKTSRKSLLRDFSDTSHLESHFKPEKKEKHNAGLRYSPAHLRGHLKLEKEHGVPFFKFSVEFPEDVYVAKPWKVDKALTWIYTFHSLYHGRKNNSIRWRLKDIDWESCMVGQMQVSSYLCTELRGAGAFNNSMVTEFVLYDTAHPRRSDEVRTPLVADESLSLGNCETEEVSAGTTTKGQYKHYCENGHFGSSNPLLPLTVEELQPDLEVAAIIMQVPFEKRKSLKFKSQDRENGRQPLNLLDLCGLEQQNAETFGSGGKMHVIIPHGNHSRPSTESRGPSPLLDRWRLGGGCDCGGWDMGCPLNVFGDPSIQIYEDRALMDNQHQLNLFVQGRKDTVPSLTMRGLEDGQYIVDFHAQLSSLQAFSICVAILHTAEASTAVGQERHKEELQCDSLRVFAEEEIKNLIDAITEEEKGRINKKMEEVLPSFVLNPPFSPIARV